MRLFIALDPPASITANLTGLQAILARTNADVRWVTPSDYHVTIKFLADAPETLLSQITERITRAAAEVPAFDLEVDGVGRFPDKGPARVIIAHIRSPDQRIIKLHRLIDSALGGIGLPMDTRVLVPHLTLGRVNSNHALNRLLRLLEKHRFDPLGTFTVETARLYHSIPVAGQMRHQLLHSAPLQVAPVANAE